ncbi:c-type cytochrome [Planctomicrobium piriforme]|uniref:Putative heme-binding domain-containing protein n=1 Tax=Planctomicrobium piriforme TaxID=1576369 RepID=A0A1I3I7N7_9PLAN|nr:c-type cytochrome [Planctomicrobium piriforme]SFI43877.1 putative heme-binding domain-containing protein [Planctomicrobium piriforme]
MRDLFFRPFRLLFVAAFLLSGRWAAAEESPHWVWLGDAKPETSIRLRKAFEFNGQVKSARLAATADDEITAYVNGHKVFEGKSWQNLETADVKARLVPGRNVIALEARNNTGSGAAIAELRIVDEQGQAHAVVTDAAWLATNETPNKWQAPDFNDQGWSAVQIKGDLGDEKLPWTKSITAKAFGSALSDGLTASELPEPAKNAKVPEGFVIEQVFEVPRSMGSWVSLTTDPQGRLLASDQQGAGLFLITPGHDGTETTVQKLPVSVSGFQGLCYAFDALYGVVNGGSNSGLHRLRDTNGDGLVDSDEHLVKMNGGGEHGPHAVILSPDGKSLYICAGNFTKLPDDITDSKVPRNWSEDHLLPRRWDANGFAAGVLAPGGWVIRVDPEGKQREIISTGFRNEYDIAFNADGELFSYDADMEWDLGAPWYRPTRVCHVTDGSEFGWRSGTGKWPPYFEDSLPPTIEIGPGSPVGIVFGYGAKFPEKYQQSLFILDWTYSTIYAIHLTPSGSSYTGMKEEFAVGQPMQVTDATIGADGALYFTAGGRGTQSTLYRIRYVGSESTAPVDAHNAAGQADRTLRQSLEKMQGHPGGDLNAIFAQLGNADRFIRYAARIALEAQPVDSWKQRALTDASLTPLARITAMIALARQGAAADLPAILTALQPIDVSALDEQPQLALLRAYELAFSRLGAPDDAWRQKVISRLDPLYPAKSYPVNAELAQLLVFLNAPGVVTKTLDLMRNLGPEPIPDWGSLVGRSNYGGTVGKMLENMPPSRAIHFAFVLRNQKEGWTLPQRQEYFQFFIDAAKRPGGHSFSRFLSQMRDDALLTCSPTDQVALQPLTNVSLFSALPKVDPPKGPGRKWTRDEALANLGEKLTKRNYDHGRQLFHAVSCSKCHRFNGEGGSIGPDLSTASKKFPPPDLFDAIIEPSKVISDQYASQQVVTTDGQVLLGRAVQIGDELHVYTPDADALPKVLKKSQVEEIHPSPISQMPVGLLDSLNPEELKDLMAYIISGGEKDSPVYK